MRLVGRWGGAAFVVAAVGVAVACGSGVVRSAGGDTGTGGSGSGGGSGGSDGGGSGGSPDGGTGNGGGGGSTDGGAGSGGGTDGGTGGQDGGTAGDAGSLQTFQFPTANPDWQFFGPQQGGPQDVYDAALDEGGNLWVAGGTEGLFLMRANASGALSGKFEKFGIADGLHPYGWVNGEVAKAMGVPDGSPADTYPDLAATPVISVAGGPAGTVFVGYQGKPSCEWNWNGNQWDPPAKWGDPAIYKSGDADRVTLAASGISVVHYDIFSGPGIVPNEQQGREKICSVLRIVWDKQRNAVWFGSNHGFSVGVADAPNMPTCNGELNCRPVWEHSHPAISGCMVDYDFTNGWCPSGQASWLTDAYWGVAIDPSNHDMWLGGANRSTKFHSGSGDYWSAQGDTEGSPGPCKGVSGTCDRWDLWPDQMPEWDPQHGVIYVSPSMRSTPGASRPDYALDDAVSGIAPLPDGTAWFGSFAHGVILVDSAGTRLADATNRLMSKNVSAVGIDPIDLSVWAGMAWGGGITRLQGATTTYYSGGPPYDGNATLGDKLSWAPVANIQNAGTGGTRRMVMAFHQFVARDSSWKPTGSYTGAVAIYKGP